MSTIGGDLAGQVRLLIESMKWAVEAELRPAQTQGLPARGPDKTAATAATPREAIPQSPPPVASTVASKAASTPAALSPRDLPVIMRALADMMPAGIPVARAAETFLQAAAAADLRPAVVEQIQRQLAPLPAALPPAELAPALRAFLAQSGVFTENHLAAALQQRPGPPTADQQQAQQQASADLRLLLGALTTAGAPAPEPVRVFGEALLQQQLAVAEQLAAARGGQMVIPFVFGEERTDIRLAWHRQARHEERQRKQDRPAPEEDQAISLGVFVNLNAFGAIEARIVWKPASFAVTFYVEREVTRAIVEAGLSDLSKELSAAGFSTVATNVWLNPERVAAGATPEKPAIPGGTILDVMA